MTISGCSSRKISNKLKTLGSDHLLAVICSCRRIEHVRTNELNRFLCENELLLNSWDSSDTIYTNPFQNL